MDIHHKISGMSWNLQILKNWLTVPHAKATKPAQLSSLRTKISDLEMASDNKKTGCFDLPLTSGLSSYLFKMKWKTITQALALWLNRMTFNLYVIHNPEVQSLQALWPSS